MSRSGDTKSCKLIEMLSLERRTPVYNSYLYTYVPAWRDITQPKAYGLPGRAKTLELAFDSKSLRTICESEAHARRELGPTVAEILKHRLADLRAATSVRDLLVGWPRTLDSESHQHMVVDLCDGYYVVFCANHPNNPMTESGQLDWSKVNRIKILRIESDHV